MATIDDRVAVIEAQLGTVADVLDGRPGSGSGGGDPALAAKVAALEEAVRRFVAATYNDFIWHQGRDVSGGDRAERFILEPLGGERQVGDGVKK